MDSPINPAGTLASFTAEPGLRRNVLKHATYHDEEERNDTIEFTIMCNVMVDVAVPMLRIEMAAFSPIGNVGTPGQRIRMDVNNVPAGSWSGGIGFSVPYKGDGFYGCQVYLGDKLIGRRAINVERIG